MPSLIEQVLAYLKPQQDAELPASVVEGRKRLEAEAPDIKSTPVIPYGLVSNLQERIRPHLGLDPTQAYYAGGNIYVNPDVMGSMQSEDVADTLLHELTHKRQAQSRSVVERLAEYINQRGPYGQRPDELEAYQVEADRRTRMGRPAGRVMPNFLTPGSHWEDDYRLNPKWIPPTK